MGLTRVASNARADAVRNQRFLPRSSAICRRAWERDWRSLDELRSGVAVGRSTRLGAGWRMIVGSGARAGRSIRVGGVMVLGSGAGRGASRRTEGRSSARVGARSSGDGAGVRAAAGCLSITRAGQRMTVGSGAERGADSIRTGGWTTRLSV